MRHAKSVHNLYDSKLNAALCKGRMVELGFTYVTLAQRVSVLARRTLTDSYISHMMNGRRRGERWWPFLAQALDAPLAYLTDPQPRRIVSPPTPPGSTGLPTAA